MIMRLTCLCHPATLSMRQGRFPPDDERLDADACAALDRLAPWEAGGDLVLTSPLHRATETAARLGLAAVAAPALRELSAGAWAGCRLDSLEPDALAAWTRDPEAAPPGGESEAALRRRIAAWMAQAPALGRHVVAVSHPAVVRAVLATALELSPQAGRRLDVAPLTVASLSWHRGWRVRGFGLPPGTAITGA